MEGSSKGALGGNDALKGLVWRALQKVLLEGTVSLKSSWRTLSESSQKGALGGNGVLGGLVWMEGS